MEQSRWWRTEHHVRVSEAACRKSCCPGERLSYHDHHQQQQQQQTGRSGALLICSPDDEPGSLDCTLYHAHRCLLEEAKEDKQWSRSVVIGRCIGLTPDTLLAEDLYRSIRSELSSNAPMDNELHWIERLGLCLPSGTRLTLVLVNIDRLDAWSAVPVARLPDNVRLLASTSGQTIVSGWTGVTLAGNPPGRLPSAWDFRAPSMEAALSDCFDGLERRFPKGLVRLTCTGLTIASAGRFTSGLTKRLTRSCIESHSSGQGHVELLGPLLQYLDPLLIRINGNQSEEEERMCWSRPALTFAKRRYADALDEKRHVASRLTLFPADSPEDETRNRGIDAPIDCVARLFSFIGDAGVPLEREKVEDTLFDWTTWQLAAEEATSLHLVWSSIRQAAARWVDSQLWLVERNLPWINQSELTADSNGEAATSTLVQHLAAQLAVALKPFAEKEGVNQHLWKLYSGAVSHCEQFRAPLLLAPSIAWNFNHSGVPLERKVLAVEPIRLMAVSPDGQIIVVVTQEASSDPLFSLSAATGRRVAVYRGHSGRVTCVHVTGDSRYLVSGSEDLSVIVWHLQTGQLLLRAREHIAAVSCLASSTIGRMVVSGGEDSIVMAFKWPGEGERLARIDHHRGPVTSLAINNRQDVLVSGSQDGSICVWSLDDWSLLNVIGVGQAVGHVTLSSDDVFLLAVGLDDRLPRLFSLTTGSPLRTWTDLSIKVVGAVIAAGNGHSYAALLAEDGRLMCYDCHGGQLVHALWIEPPGKSSLSACCARATDPRLVYHSVGHRIKIWLLRYDEKRPAPVTSSITCLAISPLDGAVVATGDVSGCVQLWRASNLSKIACWSHAAAVSVVSFDLAGLYVASAAEDGTAAVWHLDAGQTLQATQVHPVGCRVNQLIIMADWNGYVLSCDSNETVIQWKLGTGEIVRQWSQVASKAIGVALNTRWMAGLTGSNSARLWSLENGEDNKEVIAVSHTEEVLCFAVTPDSKYLITGSKDSSLKMWEALPSAATEKAGKLVQIMAGHSDHVTTVVAANLLSSSNGGPLMERQPSNAGSASGCSKRLVVVSGSRDGQLIVWDAQHGSETHSMKRHKAAITCLRVSTDGSVLVSGSEDGTVRVWNLRTGSCLSSFALTHPVQQIVMSPDASKLWVRMAQKPLPAILELKHTPAILVKPEVCSRPASPVHFKKPPPTRRLLKKEISLDSYTWLKRYGKSNSIAQHQANAHVHHAPPQSTPSVDSLLKLSRRNSFCNVPESGET